YALQRQPRFEALKSWRALLVIDLLPTLLHFSLLLFTWSNYPFLLGSYIAGRVLRSLPIQGEDVKAHSSIIPTPESTGGRLEDSEDQETIKGTGKFKEPHNLPAVQAIAVETNEKGHEVEGARSPQSDEQQVADTSDASGESDSEAVRNWNALKWFLDHARSPADVNDVYQSLAVADPSDSFIRKLLDLKLKNPKHHSQVLDMGSEAIRQFNKTLSEDGKELILWSGSNAARYALLIAEIYPYVIDVIQQKATREQPTCGDRDIQGSPAWARSWGSLWNVNWARRIFSSNVTNTVDQEFEKAKSIHDNTFEAIINLWKHEQRPYFVASAYAGLVTAELKLASCAIRKLRVPPFVTTPGDAREDNKDEVCVDMDKQIPELTQLPFEEIHQMGLRRASLLLYYHINRQAPLGSASLRALLGAIDYPARSISPDKSNDTDITATSSTAPPELNATYKDKVKIGGISREHDFSPAVIDEEHGLLVCLITILGATDLPRKTQIAAVDALALVAPMLVEQWAITSELPRPHPNLVMSLYKERPSAPNLSEHIISQLKSFTEGVQNHWRSRGIGRLAYPLFVSLRNRSDASSEEAEMIDFLAGRPGLNGGWITWAARHSISDDMIKGKTDQHQNRAVSSTIYRIFLTMQREAKYSVLDGSALIDLASLIQFVCKYPPEGWKESVLTRFWPTVSQMIQHQDLDDLESPDVYDALERSLKDLAGIVEKPENGIRCSIEAMVELAVDNHASSTSPQ
ncbi:hypothetical protein RHS03_01178, partial [Rhizoctonia solani]